MSTDSLIENHYLHLGSTIRNELPANTLAKLQPIAQAIGITRVANVTGLDHIGIPVALCIRPNAKHLSVSQGKGSTWELAKISAIMESIEGYHAENPAPPQLTGSYPALQAQYPVINPQLFNPCFFQIPPLENWELAWTAARNLITQESVYLPQELICLDSTRIHTEYGFFNVNSNGLAGGNTLEEAICHGLYEVIERDCVMRWQTLTPSQQQQTQIALESIHSPMNQAIIDNFLKANITVRIWDVASALGIPAFICSISDNNLLRGLHQFEGSGAHLSKEIALARALTEAAQSRLTLISGSRDDVFPQHYAEQKKLIPAEKTLGQRSYSNCVEPKLFHCFADDINYLLEILQTHHFNQVFVVDHTRPEFNVPIVHVFVPGMHFNGHRI